MSPPRRATADAGGTAQPQGSRLVTRQAGTGVGSRLARRLTVKREKRTRTEITFVLPRRSGSRRGARAARKPDCDSPVRGRSFCPSDPVPHVSGIDMPTPRLLVALALPGFVLSIGAWCPCLLHATLVASLAIPGVVLLCAGLSRAVAYLPSITLAQYEFRGGCSCMLAHPALSAYDYPCSIRALIKTPPSWPRLCRHS